MGRKLTSLGLRLCRIGGGKMEGRRGKMSKAKTAEEYK